MRGLVWVLCVVPLLAGCGQSAEDKYKADQVYQHSVRFAYELCYGDDDAAVIPVDDGSISLGDSKHTLILSGLKGAAMDDNFGCFEQMLHMSDGLKSEVENTTALMGRQTATDDGKSYSWSYHPDNGLNMTVED